MPKCKKCTVIYPKVYKQTQFNAKTKTIVNENATKRNPKACSTEQNAETKTKVNKSKRTRPEKLKRQGSLSLHPAVLANEDPGAGTKMLLAIVNPR